MNLFTGRQARPQASINSLKWLFFSYRVFSLRLSQFLSIVFILQIGFAQEVLAQDMAVSDMLGVANKCQSSYGTDGMLNIPCVRVSGVLYAATLQQISAAATETQFTLTSATPIEEAQESKNVCEATYSLETGRLDIPCVNGIDNVSLYAIDNYESPSVFVYKEIPRLRINSRCLSNSSVAVTRNPGVFTTYGYANPLDNFANIQQNYAIGNPKYPDHLGVDYMTPVNSNVYAICDGTITADSQDFTYQRVNRGRGLYSAYWNARIILKCNSGNNLLAIYGHVDQQAVSNGSTVKKGSKIAIIAPAYNSSNVRSSSLDHLHFGIRTGYTNPFYSAGVGFGIATENVSLSQAEQRGFQDPLNYLCSNPISTITYFDGAGSLISPTQTGVGANSDIAIMQPHADIGTTSTVVFQFKKDTNCDHIDISSTPKIDATIQSKDWQDHLISTAFGVALPVSVSSSKGGFTVVAVTSAIPLTSSVRIDAQCKPISSPRVNAITTSFADEASKLVTLGNDYYWTGTGSIISSLGTGTGKTADVLPTFDTKKSFSSFQWRTTSSCSKLTLSPPAGKTTYFSGTDSEVSLKLWNSPTWQAQSCTRLPCTIYAPSIGNYYIVKVKTQAGALSGTSGVTNTGYLNAKCE
jgi:murein DD-endopeptidase MepM/ murein hydrolase activator NlpD